MGLVGRAMYSLAHPKGRGTRWRWILTESVQPNPFRWVRVALPLVAGFEVPL